MNVVILLLSEAQLNSLVSFHNIGIYQTMFSSFNDNLLYNSAYLCNLAKADAGYFFKNFIINISPHVTQHIVNISLYMHAYELQNEYKLKSSRVQEVSEVG